MNSATLSGATVTVVNGIATVIDAMVSGGGITGPGALALTGTLIKSAEHTVAIAAALNFTGAIQVDAGTLTLENGGDLQRNHTSGAWHCFWIDGRNVQHSARR